MSIKIRTLNENEQALFKLMQSEVDREHAWVHRLEDKLAEARAALGRYGRHEAHCPRWGTRDTRGDGKLHDCTCGLAVLTGEGDDA